MLPSIEESLEKIAISLELLSRKAYVETSDPVQTIPDRNVVETSDNEFPPPGTENPFPNTDISSEALTQAPHDKKLIEKMERNRLKTELDRLGVRYNKQWGVKNLQKELTAALLHMKEKQNQSGPIPPAASSTDSPFLPSSSSSAPSNPPVVDPDPKKEKEERDRIHAELDQWGIVHSPQLGTAALRTELAKLKSTPQYQNYYASIQKSSTQIAAPQTPQPPTSPIPAGPAEKSPLIPIPSGPVTFDMLRNVLSLYYEKFGDAALKNLAMTIGKAASPSLDSVPQSEWNNLYAAARNALV
jgi:hypothetical protein